MLKEFISHIENNLSFLKNKKILIACSGGLDSMVLVSLVKRMDLNFSVAHCNFKLRGKESDEDEDFIMEQCQRSQIPIYIKNFDTAAYAKDQKISIQMAARDLRYQWFTNIAKEKEYECVLTAHHLDDSLETFLINISRGTGIEGLLGIPEINGIYIRPLLPFSRNQILKFAHKHAIAWREDSSNENVKYMRNKIRHDVIPVLKTLQPNFLSNFQTTVSHLKQTNSFVTNETKRIKEAVFTHKDPDQIEINIAELFSYGNPEVYLYELLKQYGFTAWDDIAKIVVAQSGKQIFSQSHRLLKDRESLLLVPILEEVTNRKYKIPEDENVLMIPQGMMKFKEVDKLAEADLTTIYVDKEKLNYPLTVRKWEEGDYFYPLGMKGKKKLSKYFKDEKLSLLAKERVWLLCSGKDIVWIIHYRADDRFKITSQTKRLLKVTITQ